MIGTAHTLFATEMITGYENPFRNLTLIIDNMIKKFPYHNRIGPLQAVKVLHAILYGFRAFLTSDENGGLVIFDGFWFPLEQSPLASLVPGFNNSLHQSHR
jgi:hypothetical protein